MVVVTQTIEIPPPVNAHFHMMTGLDSGESSRSNPIESVQTKKGYKNSGCRPPFVIESNKVQGHNNPKGSPFFILALIMPLIVA